ncbi:MAG: tRNA 2-thiouridine(34) synthase MnmA, partial [Bacteroidales bacterium]
MKIAVGLSGGVDSSVAALLLKEAGHDVIGMFMQNWHDTTGTLHGDCPWKDDLTIAKLVAKKLDIPFHFVDLSATYSERVVDYMFSEYSKGRTPNPDVLCNREIKFEAFLKIALELGADYVATGHYCRKETITDAAGNQVHRLMAGTDSNKDQSYFLCQLSQNQLSKALFPIGELLKPQVRELAAKAGLPSADKKDSQGICFVGKIDLPLFLQQKLASVEGDVIEVFRDFYRGNRLAGYNVKGYDILNEDNIPEMSKPFLYDIKSGKKIGKHQGAQFYTVGQRKGLNIGGHIEPLF